MTVPFKIWLKPEASLTMLQDEAQKQGWTSVMDRPRSHTLKRMLTWSHQGLQIGWSEDHQLEVRYVWVEGNRSLAEVLAQKLPHWTEAELHEAAAAADLRTRLRALRTWTDQAGTTLPEGLKQHLTVLARHEDILVRQTILTICFLGGWPELLPLIQQLGTEEADSHLAELWCTLAEIIEERSQKKATHESD